MIAKVWLPTAPHHCRLGMELPDFAEAASIPADQAPQGEAPDASRRRLLDPGIERIVAGGGEAAEMAPGETCREQRRLEPAVHLPRRTARPIQPGLGLRRQAARHLP